MAAGQPLLAQAPLAAAEYFSETYWEAREKFRYAAAAVGAELQILKVKEPDYTIDVAVVPAVVAPARGPARGGGGGLLLHSSGVHGAEGFAGSAVQTAMLHEMHCSGQRPIVTCVLIHAINPFGMAHYRRANENNVDLNRNALTDAGWREVLARHPNLAGYEDFQDLLVPGCAPTWCFAYLTFWLRTVYLLVRYGTSHLKRAMVSATYTHPTGIFYGGQELQPSHRLLYDFLRQRFGTTPAATVGWVDVHTGLGPKSVDVLLTSTEDKNLVAQSFLGADVQCTGTVGNKKGSQADGYELVRGFMNTFYGGCFDTSRGPALIATQEFGTWPGIKVVWAMVVENRGFHFDLGNHERWSTFTRDAFYVRETRWKENVLKRGCTVFQQLLDLVSARAAGRASAGASSRQ